LVGVRIRHRIRHRIRYYAAYHIRCRMHLRGYDIVYDMQHTMSYTMSYVFAHHHLRPLKWLTRVFHDEPCISHCIFIYSRKSYMILSMHCAAAHDVRACAAPSSTHTVTINIYHFKGSVAHRPPLVHPDCPLELFCTPTVPLRGHATTVCMGSEARQVLKPLLQPPAWPKQNDLLHPDPYREAIRYPLRGPAHLMGPLASSTAS
jgi:hypothetical protein